MKKIYLIDVSSLFFRAFYAIRPLTAPDGTPVNAIYGLLSMIVKLFKTERPNYLVFCYDRKEPSFRKELYEDYKAHRTEMPEDLVKQIPFMKQMAELLGIPALEIPRFEADDVIGTLTRLATEKKFEVVIVSGDKDFAQLVRPGVVLYDTMKDSRTDESGVVEKWGVRPSQFQDYLAIVGDSSDNIPGVEGLGPKGAQKLLTTYGSLEAIYENLDQVTPASAQEKLRKNQEMAFLSKKLVAIDLNVPIDSDLETYRLKGLRRDELRAFLQRLNFKAFEKSLLGEDQMELQSPAAAEKSDALTEQKSSAPSAPTATGVIRHQGAWTLKTVTASQFLEECRELRTLWVWSQSQGVFFSDGRTLWSVSGDLASVQKELEQREVGFQGFDLKSVWRELKGFNPKIEWDSMIASYVIRAGDCTDFHKVYSAHAGEPLSEMASPEDYLQAHLRLKGVLEEKLKAHENQKIYQSLDLPLAPILLRMEQRGVKVDLKFLKAFSEELAYDLEKTEKKIWSLAGESFNVGSPKQLGVILFEKLKLPVVKKTKTGYSTDNEVLQEIEHPIGKEILEYRELAKLKSTYVDALPEMANPETHRVHTHFNQALTTTGRLSSTQPNLQNIPIRTERGARVREAFIAEKGHELLSVDYSQIELRVLAHISDDPGLIRAFREDLDIHAATASEVFGVKLQDVTSEQRRRAKAVNFGIAYGQGAFGLAEVLGIPRSEAQDIIKRYFHKFKGIQEYITETIKRAHERGYVETLFGRRRYLDELQSKNNVMKKFGERAAINAPIQGTAADLMKKAMIEVDQKCALPLLLQVHDELVFEGTPEQIEEWKGEIVRIMESVMTLKVPLKVNTK
ncbi:MAG: DNA polymerase I [Bdellovibrionales bacterium]